MSKRMLGLLVLIVAAAAVGWVIAVGRLNLGAKSAADEGGLRTAWGDPDLQGLWAQAYDVPMQRPVRDAGKTELTDAEVAQREADRNQPKPPVPQRQNPNAKRGTYDHLIGAYDLTFQNEGAARRPIGKRTSLIIDPSDGRMPAQTAAVKQRTAELRQFQLDMMQSVEMCKDRQDINCFEVKYTGKVSPRFNDPPPSYLAAQILGDRVLNRANNPEDWGLGERCLGSNLPVIGAVQRIVQSPDSVAITYEGFTRVIPITTAPHLPSSIRQWLGDSRGHWEGNTLVVDVTNFTPKTDYEGSRENLHLVERFTRTDAHMLEYVVTLEDPTAWKRPWTVKVEMGMQDQVANALYDEPRCHDGNYALLNMLLGVRSDDQAFAEGRGPDPATICYLICGNGDPAYAAQRMGGRGGAPPAAVDGQPAPRPAPGPGPGPGSN